MLKGLIEATARQQLAASDGAIFDATAEVMKLALERSAVVTPLDQRLGTKGHGLMLAPILEHRDMLMPRRRVATYNSLIPHFSLAHPASCHRSPRGVGFHLHDEAPGLGSYTDNAARCGPMTAFGTPRGTARC